MWYNISGCGGRLLKWRREPWLTRLSSGSYLLFKNTFFWCKKVGFRCLCPKPTAPRSPRIISRFSELSNTNLTFLVILKLAFLLLLLRSLSSLHQAVLPQLWTVVPDSVLRVLQWTISTFSVFPFLFSFSIFIIP